MKIYYGNEIPKLTQPQCSVLQAELSTGIVLTTDGKRRIESESPFILIFDSFEDAKQFSKEKIIENPSFECNVYDYQGNFVERTYK